jgi:16S rRNA (uracil1498-N3)-methyltransferase
VAFPLAHPFGQPVTQVVLDDLAPAHVRIEGDDARHLARVLRLRPGDSFVATDARGGVARLEAEAVDRNGIAARVVERATVPPPALRLWMVADAEGARGDWLVEKAVELGAYAFLPVGGAEGGRVRRWERLARAALKQSLGAHGLALPEAPALEVAQARAAEAERSGAGFAAWIAHPGGADPVAQALVGQGDLFLVSGAAGGFAAAQLAAWEALPGAVGVGLGPSRLRAETAALTLLALARLRSSGA